MSKPWKLCMDWTCANAYPGDPVVVELHIMDEEPRVLRKFPDIPEAAAWARKFIEDRGLEWWCNIDWHQRENHTHITLHPGSPSRKPQGQKVKK
jgi:hypothetical protein